MEINSTFYHRPTFKTLERWYNGTGPHFKFFIKIPKTLTHLQKLENVKALAADFCTHISSGLKEKLAGLLYQLPPSFHCTDGNMLLLREAVDPKYLNVVEFRHESWWNVEVLQKLKQKKSFSAASVFRKILLMK